jgi:hypothetical protein
MLLLAHALVHFYNILMTAVLLLVPVCRSARFVFIPYGDLVFYLLGSGEYDELAGEQQSLLRVARGGTTGVCARLCEIHAWLFLPSGADILRTYVGLLRDVLGKQQITSSFLLDTRNYMKMVLVLDELINEVRC